LQAVCNFFDPAVLQQNVGFGYLTFIDQLRIAYNGGFVHFLRYLMWNGLLI
jgi:hypothetical protein